MPELRQPADRSVAGSPIPRAATGRRSADRPRAPRSPRMVSLSRFTITGPRDAALRRAHRSKGGAAVTLAADLADEGAVPAFAAARRATPRPSAAWSTTPRYSPTRFRSEERRTAGGLGFAYCAVRICRAPVLFLLENFCGRLPEQACMVPTCWIPARRITRPAYFVSYTLSKMGLWTLTQTP